MKIIVAIRDSRLDAFVIHFARPIDIFPQSFVEVALRSSFHDLLFVVQLNLRNQQARETPRIVMLSLFFFVADVDRKGGIITSISASRSECSRRRFGRRCSQDRIWTLGNRR